MGLLDKITADLSTAEALKRHEPIVAQTLSKPAPIPAATLPGGGGRRLTALEWSQGEESEYPSEGVMYTGSEWRLFAELHSPLYTRPSRP